MSWVLFAVVDLLRVGKSRATQFSSSQYISRGPFGCCMARPHRYRGGERANGPREISLIGAGSGFVCLAHVSEVKN